MEVIRGVISKIRSVKASYNLSNAQKPAVFIQVDTQELHNLIKSQLNSIQTQSFCGDITILSKDEQIPQGCAIEIVNPQCKTYISLKGMINIEQEIKKLQKKEAELSKAVQNIRDKMNDPQYDKVPEKVKQGNAERLAKYEGELKNVKFGLETLLKIKDS
jgi:valyl-tRNA synthetase